MSKDTRTVVLLCNYAAKYSGNFISSIQDLITAGRYRFIVVLPKEAKNYQWSRIRNAEVRFIDFSFFSDSIVVLPVTEYVKSIFDTVDFFVSPSRGEAFGYAVVEASSSSCEVIASLVPGQDTLKDIPETIWISPNDSVGLANAITDRIPLLHSSDFSSRKDYILSHYSIAAWVNSVNARYSEVFSL